VPLAYKPAIMMHKPSSFLFPTLYLFGFLLSFVTCAIKTQEEYLALFNTLPEEYYKNRLVFFTGVDARSEIVNFQRGWEAKLANGCLGDRPTDVLVLRDVLVKLGEKIPDADDPDIDKFWSFTSHALATVASGTIYVLVPSDPAKWGTFYRTVEKDLLLKNSKVQNVLELEFDGSRKGQVTTVVKGAKEFDSIDLLTAKEYEKLLGPTALVNLNEELQALTPEQERRKAAVFARLSTTRKKAGSGSNTGGSNTGGK